MTIVRYLKNLFAVHELLFTLVRRDVLAKYKQAFMGALWAILQPLVLMVMFTMVFSRFARVPSEGIPYSIFSYTALLPWGFFSGGIAAACGSIVGNTAMIIKIKMPTEVFPFSAILARGVDLAISTVVFIGMMFIYHVSPNMTILWVVPLLLTQFLLMSGIGLFLSSLAVFYRDINFGIGLFLQMWMFASPVAYPLSIVPERYLGIYMLNPMVTIVDGYRKAILHAEVPDLERLSVVFAAASVFFIFSYLFFKHQEGKFADLV